jgi:hypothetical protein
MIAITYIIIYLLTSQHIAQSPEQTLIPTLHVSDYKYSDYVATFPVNYNAA